MSWEHALRMALWFVVLVVVPGVGQERLVPVLDRHRIDAPPKRPRGRMVWRWRDTRPGNYDEQGRKLLRVFKLLHAAQVAGFLTWGAWYVI